MASEIVHTGRKKSGPPLVYPVRITLPLTEEMLADVDAARGDGEARVDLIRAAITAELERRAHAPLAAK